MESYYQKKQYRLNPAKIKNWNMLANEKALSLCQKFGYTTFFTNCNEGMTLPLYISKKCAIILVDEIINGNFGEGYDHIYWLSVKEEIEKL